MRDKYDKKRLGAAPLPRTHDGIVYIPVIDRKTRKPTGREATVSVEDGDLAAHTPWFADEAGVYALVNVLRTPLKVYMHDLVLTRHYDDAILVSGLRRPGHDSEMEAQEAPSRSTVQVCCTTPATADGLYNYITRGLQNVGHSEFHALAPGFCKDLVVDLLLFCARQVIEEGRRFKGGDVVELGTFACGLVEMRGEHEDEPARLQIIDLPEQLPV